MSERVIKSREAPAALSGDVLKKFFFIRKALHRQQFAAVLAMARRYGAAHPEVAHYFQEVAALALKEDGDLLNAARMLHQVHAAFDGNNLPVLYNLSTVLRELEQLDEALQVVEEGLRRFPEDTVLLLDKWRICFAKGRLAEAHDGIRHWCAQRSDAETVSQLFHLADFAFALGRYEESMDAFERVHALSPLNETAWGNHIFLAHYMPSSSPESLRELLRRCQDAYAAHLPPTPPERLARELNPEKKVRIGIVSAGLAMHPVGWMSSTSLLLLSRLPHWELYYYDTRTNKTDPTDPFFQTFMESATQWLHVGNWSLDKIYNRLLDDELDMVLDMAGHASGGYSCLFVQRVAPLQVKWVGGLFNSSGVENMDYLLSDEYETPKGVDSFYTEKIIRLPHSYVSYTPPLYGHDVRPVPRLTDINEGRLCFGCFNNVYKINPEIVGVWARILHSVPDSFMYLKDSKLKHEEARRRIRNLFEEHGIPESRLLLEGPSPHWELLTCYNRVDIALDTWPYTGGLTTLEALWMGVPVITTPGPSFAGRHALSHLCNVGLEEFVCKDFQAYEALAVELAKHPNVLDGLRQLLRLRILQSPLVDHAQRAADLDTALRAAWMRHCEGLPPVPMRFEAVTPLSDGMRAAWGASQSPEEGGEEELA